MNLLELQRRMSEDVRRPLNPDFTMQARTADRVAMGDIAASYIRPNTHLTSFERLEIYNRQYWFRVIESISEDFPALNAVLGSKRFEALVLAYLQENPSTSFTLRDLGARLPSWLAAYPGRAGTRRSLAVDVARLEWAYIEAFDSASLSPLGSQDLASLSAGSTLRLQPHLRLLHLRYPVDELVLFVHNATAEAEVASNAAAEYRPGPSRTLTSVKRSNVYLAVHRFENSVYCRRMDREEFLLFTSLRSGDSIPVAIEDAFAGCKLAPAKLAAKIQEYFAHASELGWLCLAEPPTQPWQQQSLAWTHTY